MTQRTRANSPTKVCTLDDCDRPLRAKGLCAYHYNAGRQRKTAEVTCPTCGEVTLKRDDGKATRNFCSLLCRDLWRVDQPDDPMFRTGIRVCPLPADHPARWFGQACSLDLTVCATCGVLFAHRPRRRTTCSASCADRARQHRKRGRARVKRSEIFERDGYICWICDLPTSSHYFMGDPLSPTVDHLVPVAFGGGDETDNLATAHMICNSRRGASWDVVPAA